MNEKQIASSAVVFIIAVGAFIFTSCSDFSTDLKGDSVLDYGTGAGSLLTCNDKLEGKVVKPADGSEYRLCKGGQWFAVEIGDFDEADVIKLTAKSSSSEKEDSMKSSSSQKGDASKDPVENLYICEDGETIVENIDNCPENQEPESSSSEEANSSPSEDEVDEPEPESSSETVIDPNAKYDCAKYNCVTTEYLNQEMLAAGKYGELLDERDNQVYRTIKIGDQVWMAQNLNYETENSRCYSGSTENCAEFGRLYYQSEAKDVCPSGWHLPSNEEWNILNDFVDDNNGTQGVGNSLKSLTWTYGKSGSDLFGFSGLASHFFGSVLFCGSSTHGLYWTADNNEYRCLLSDNSILYYYKDSNSDTWGMSVRCLKDDNTQNPSIESSSSEETVEPESSSAVVAPLAKYDCSEYNCVTTEYLNQELLAAGKYGEILDERDNQVYRTIKIGEQTWMAQNLNYDTTTAYTYCASNTAVNCQKYGRIYKSSIALKVCPTGWHLPKTGDWQNLYDFVYSNKKLESNTVGSYLKSTKLWTTPGTDDYGFAAVPGGYLWYNGTYKNVDIGGYFWTTTTGTSLNNIPWYFPGGETLTTDDVRSTSDGFYVRCVMN